MVGHIVLYNEYRIFLLTFNKKKTKKHRNLLYKHKNQKIKLELPKIAQNFTIYNYQDDLLT